MGSGRKCLTSVVEPGKICLLMAVLVLQGLFACGGSSRNTTDRADMLAVTGEELVISAAALDPDTGSILISGRNFTGGYAPVVTLDGIVQTVTDYNPTEITASYTGPADPLGALLLTVQRGPALTDHDSYSIVLGAADPADPVNHNQLVIWSLRVEMLSGQPWLVIVGN
ncbi:MAG: hypothetical protein JSV00_09100, partial [bacterium]